MAKKKEVLSDGTSLPSVFDLVKSVDNSAEIIAESAYSNISDWISTGNYILNAALSGDLFNGIAVGRVTVLEGDPGSGKSYLACSICREAQKKGYTPIYLDSEGACDAQFVSRLGVDPKNLIIKQVSTIAETSQFIANICAKLQEQEDKFGEHQKILLVLDSLGNLTSDKERDDIMAGTNKRDMTKAQEIKALFRVNATPMAKLQIGMVVCNHVYASIGSYVPTSIGAGGCLVPTEKIITSNGIKNIKDIQINDKVLSHDGKYHNVSKTWKFKKPTFIFEYENGEKIECSNTHKFLIDFNHPELENSWKTADKLVEGDEIYILDNN